MAPFLISYDINEKDTFEYQPLWDKLKALGAVRILFSEWVILIQPSQYVSLYNERSSIIQAKDRLLVQELGLAPVLLPDPLPEGALLHVELAGESPEHSELLRA